MTTYVQIICSVCNKEKIRQSQSVKKVIAKNGNYLCRPCKTKISKKHKGTQIHNSYAAAKSRCNNKSDLAYKNYGGRGIKFMWQSFNDFLKDMGDTHFYGATIERMDVNGNYCIENCKWATRTDQARNTRKNIHNTESIAQIRKFYKEGVTQVKLAKMFCDTQGNISNIILNKTWVNA
jgi:hypothetical protein